MLQSGIPIDRALDHLSRGTPDPCLAQASGELARRLRRGATLSGSMLACQPAFSLFQCEAVALGERSGKLDSLLIRLADQEERSVRLRLRLKTALHYPMLVAGVAFLGIILGPPLLFKNLLPLLQASPSLPWLTQLFLAFSLCLRDLRFWLLAGVSGALAFRAFQMWHSHPRNARWLRQKLLAWPVLGRLLKSQALADFSRALSVQFEVGCDTRQAFHQAARCSQDLVLIQTIEGACQRLLLGQSMSKSLASIGYFPPTFTLIFESGEECGDLVRSTARLGTIYDEDLDYQACQFAALVEPMAVMLLGGAAALTVVALVVPLIRLSETLL